MTSPSFNATEEVKYPVDPATPTVSDGVIAVGSFHTDAAFATPALLSIAQAAIPATDASLARLPQSKPELKSKRRRVTHFRSLISPSSEVPPQMQG
jgi:hypothetical protein